MKMETTKDMKKIIYILLLSLSSISLIGQDMTMYNLHYAPQSLQVNTGFMPESNWYVALPGLNLPAISVSNTFGMADLFETRGDYTYIDFTTTSSALNGGNGALEVGMQVDVLNFGFKFAEKHFIHLQAQTFANIKFGYNNGLINLLRYGFADSSNIGTRVTITNFGPEISAYSKVGIGYTYQLNEKMSIGVRPNYYMGHAYLSTLNTNIGFYTSPELDQLLVQADIEIQAGGVGTILNNYLNLNQNTDNGQGGETYNPLDDLNLFANNGFGVDFGVNAAIDKTLHLSASVVDLGYIRWKENTMTHTMNAEIDFRGMDLSALTGGGDTEEGSTATADTSNSSGIDSLLTSITDQLVITGDNSAFTTFLSTKVYLAGNWHMNEYVHLGFLIRSELENGGLKQAMTIAPSFKLGRAFNATISYTAANGTFNNIGLGLAWNAGPVQLYLVSDNLYGFTQYDYMRTTNFRFGINIRPKAPEEGRRRKRR
jgi:hypothetical protein